MLNPGSWVFIIVVAVAAYYLGHKFPAPLVRMGL